jgi:hypothetical protein
MGGFATLGLIGATLGPVSAQQSSTERALAVECPAMLKHPDVRREADLAFHTVGDWRSTTLRNYRALGHSGPPLADVQAAWDQLGDDDTVRAICFPHLPEWAAAWRRSIAAKQAAGVLARQEAAEERRRIAVNEAIEAAKPRNRLYRAYASYVIVKQCHDQRDGYMMVYVTDTEVERAREAMVVIEKKVLAEDPSLPATEIWARASNERRINFYSGYNWSWYRETCQAALATILRAVRPAPVAKDF